MGRKGSGVEVRETSIRLSFTVEGDPHRHTLKLNGKPLPPTPANVKRAHRIAADIRRDIEAGAFDLARYFPDEALATKAAAGPTVKQHLQAWMAAQRGAASTLRTYDQIVRFWIDATCDEHGAKLGEMHLQDVREQHISTALASRPDLTPRTHNANRQLLGAAFEAAIVNKLVTENPVKHVKRARQPKPQPDPFSRDEIEAILSDLAAHAPECVCNMVEWWAFSGARTSEVFGLRWPSVDLAKSRFEVSRALVQGIDKEGTKTGESRIVLMNSRALEAIQRQRKHTQTAGGLVWLRPSGEPWLRADLFQQRWWEPCLRRAGIRYRRPYNLRHTYATMLLMAGVNSAFAAKQLGHDIQIFLETYSRWLDGDANAREMARMEASLHNPSPERRTG